MLVAFAAAAALAAPAPAPLSSDAVDYTVPNRWPGGAAVRPPTPDVTRTLSHKLSDMVSVRE